MPFGPASLLGVERFSEESEAPLELIPGDDDARKEQIIRAVYKQVLGNAYVMDSERQGDRGIPVQARRDQCP